MKLTIEPADVDRWLPETRVMFAEAIENLAWDLPPL